MGNRKTIVLVVVGILVIAGILAAVLFFLQRFENEAIRASTTTRQQPKPAVQEAKPQSAVSEPSSGVDDQMPTENGKFLN